MKVITVSNQKGGVGKTTITFHLAHYLWKQGHCVLAIDLDPQGNLTSTFLTDELDDDTWKVAHVKKIFEDGVAYPIEVRERLMILPSDIRLAVIETQTSLTNYYKLKRFTDKLKGIDYVVIDTPPNLGLFTINALLAATHIVIPIQPSRYAQIALSTLLATVESIKESSGGGGEIAGVVITRAKTNTRMYQETVEWLRTAHPGLLIEPAIPDTVKVQYSIRERIPVFEKYPKDKIVEVFESLCKNIKEAIDNG